jgi:hypothetical protein
VVVEIDLGRGGRCKEVRMLDLKLCTERWGSMTGRDSWSERGFFWLKAEGNGKEWEVPLGKRRTGQLLFLVTASLVTCGIVDTAQGDIEGCGFIYDPELEKASTS